MSMAKRLLGKSRTCPLLAATSNSEPRYLLIVRALAGDSTMTRFFFFRAATANSSKSNSARGWVRGLRLALCPNANLLQSYVASATHPYYTASSSVKSASGTLAQLERRKSRYGNGFQRVSRFSQNPEGRRRGPH